MLLRKSIPIINLGFINIVCNTNRGFTNMAFNNSIQLLDGGLGSDLFINGGVNQDLLNNDPLWLARYLITDLNVLLKSHIRFINAGCDIITTGSYQASVQGFVKHAGITEAEAKAAIGYSVDIARKAVKLSKVDRAVKIAGSISPYGAILHDMSEYTGAYINSVTQSELMDFHRTNVDVLVSKGVDIIAIETIPALAEATAILNILAQCPNNTSAWVSFTTDNGIATSYGDSFVNVFQTLANYRQVVAIGINCCKSETVAPFIEIAKLHLGKHQKLILYPDNRKNPEKRLLDREDKTKIDGLYWLSQVDTWLNSGVVGIIGGCCMVKPSEISEIKSIISTFRAEN